MRTASIAILTTALLSFAPQQATAASAPQKPEPEPLIFTASVKVETFTETGKLKSVKHYGSKTRGRVLRGDGIGMTPRSTAVLARSGSGGSSSASGCRKVTVTNTGKSAVFKTTQFKYKTSTRWCWNRARQRILRGVRTDWAISTVSSTMIWRGQVKKTLLFYDYSTNNGRPRSAFKHYRQGRFENCVLKVGCIGNYYPANLIRSYYNGTWVWTTSGV